MLIYFCNINFGYIFVILIVCFFGEGYWNILDIFWKDFWKRYLFKCYMVNCILVCILVSNKYILVVYIYVLVCNV